MTARNIFDLPRDAHSSPLLEELQLEDLSERQKKHILQIVSNSVGNNCHPAYQHLFELKADSTVETAAKSK